MTVHLQNLGNQAKAEAIPAIINTVGTGALAYAGQFVPQLVSYVTMAPEVLAGASVLTSLSGSLVNVLGRTFAAGTFESNMVKTGAHAVGAFASAYFLPQIATLAGMAITFESAMAVAAASTIVKFAALFLMPEKKPAEEDKRTKADLEKLDDKAFEALAKDIADGKKVLTDKDAKQYEADRSAVSKTHDWDAKLYAKHLKDGKLNQEEYKKEGTEKKAA
ncbi:hypothetical protein [Simkania negevensis]|uniref:Uncharacterized protein n=1 Tax=Simkania negevensis (strain ATCC VR-1471 / DSM 27360 / Z) TaxID=331113 RepID=F8L8W6_SIMNZ|nr:hypothetical protein [Simkania negevensis]CCB89262.1 unknown protein [Simkania negevensis Z]